MSSVIVPMTRNNFDGYCSQCRLELPAGTQRMWHRFSRQIFCSGCGDAKNGHGKARVARAKEKDEVFITRLLSEIAWALDIDVEAIRREVYDDENPKRQTNFAPPAQQHGPNDPKRELIVHEPDGTTRHILVFLDDPRLAESTFDDRGKPNYYKPGAEVGGGDGVGSLNQRNEQILGANR